MNAMNLHHIRSGLALAVATLLAHSAWAQDALYAPEAVSLATTQGWMHADVGAAWAQGYKGRGATITVVDQFNSGNTISGNFSGSLQQLRHGDWTAAQAGLIATESTLVLSLIHI